MNLLFLFATLRSTPYLRNMLRVYAHKYRYNSTSLNVTGMKVEISDYMQTNIVSGNYD